MSTYMATSTRGMPVWQLTRCRTSDLRAQAYLRNQGLEIEVLKMLELLENNSWMAGKVLLATWETIYMVLISVLSYLEGLPLESSGYHQRNHILENKA